MLSAVVADTNVKPPSMGTVIYFKWLKDEIVVVADSRAKVGNSHRDDECKIATSRNKSIFASSGTRHLEVDTPSGSSLGFGILTLLPKKHSNTLN
jgi:hypothetical protein